MSPAVLALAVVLTTAASALPLRSDLQSGDLYPGFLHEGSYEESKPLGRNLDSIGGGNLLRDLESGLVNSRYMFPRANREQHMDYIRGTVFGSSKRMDPLRGTILGAEKRNGMDEIDRSGFNSFIKKKNFDEIDRSGFDGFVKRNFDEIDRSGFNGFVKRGAPTIPRD